MISPMNTPSQLLGRRAFLHLGAMASLGFAAASRAQATPGPGPVRGVLRPAVNAYSFLEQLNANLADSTKGIDLFGVLDFCAKHEVAAADLTGYFFPGYPGVPKDGYVSKIKKYAHERGISISGTGVKNDFATADRAVRRAGVELTKTWIEVAASLGAPVIRVFAGPHGGKDWKVAAGGASRTEVEAWMADDLRVCAEHGRRYGVLVAIQNHGDFLGSGPEHVSLLKRVGHEWCGALVDTGKYFTEDPYADIAMMVPYAFNWQVKETLGSSLKSPATDYRRLVRILRAGGYRGFVPIETLAMGRKDYDPAVEVLKVLDGLREALGEPR